MREIIRRARCLAEQEWRALWMNCADSSVVCKKQVRTLANNLRKAGRENNTEEGLVKRFAARICERQHLPSAF